MSWITTDLLLLLVAIGFITVSLGLAFNWVIQGICDFMEVRNGIRLYQQAMEQQLDEETDDPTL